MPLRPLTLSDMFNGAFAYMRANPKATLGLTAIVVVAAQVLALILSLWPLALSGDVEQAIDSAATGATMFETGAGIASMLSSLTAGLATALSTILLSGLLTVVIGRAIFGSGITIGEAWQRLKPRLWALLGFTVLEAVGALVLIGIVVAIVAAVGVFVNGWAAVAVAIPLGVGALAVLVYVGTMLAFTPAAIVLERLDIVSAVRRSFALIRGDFWRVLGIRLLAMLVAQLVAGAVAIPFSFGGQVLLSTGGSVSAAMVALVIIAVGGAIGQIITGPFSAGIVVLQYTDRRIRSEAFDLVLQTGAVQTPTAAHSTDDLWLTGRR